MGILDWARRHCGSILGAGRRSTGGLAADEPAEDSRTAQLRVAIQRHTSGDLDGAHEIYQQLLGQDPDFVPALHFAGRIHGQREEFAQASRYLQRALSLDPQNVDAIADLANVCLLEGRRDKARKLLEQLSALKPEDEEALEQLGRLLLETGEEQEALKVYRKIAEAHPDSAFAWINTARIATRLKLQSQAIDWYRRSLEIDPQQPETLNELGVLHLKRCEYEAAVECFTASVTQAPDSQYALHNLAGACHMQGRHEEALDYYAKALAISPFESQTLSNMIGVCNYIEPGEGPDIRVLYERFRQSLASERRKAVEFTGCDFSNNRRLRVGYVSPDFKRHSVAFFIEPVILGHDRASFEVFCYSNVAEPDATSRALEKAADCWRDISRSDDDNVAGQVRADAIDILVDLTGHFEGNRLRVFARRPSPLQLSYLGFPASTGLEEIGFRLTDYVADPPGENGAYYSEELVRLSKVFLCYQPPGDAPPVEVSPATRAGVQFGSFNELRKLSDAVISAWADILREVPGSTLLVKSMALGDPGTRERAKARLERAGIEAERLTLLGHTETLAEHLALYGHVDVALDTFPYNGTTTTCEALYMGVPVVTLRGSNHVGRVGASILSCLDLQQLVARSSDEYRRVAVRLAQDAESRKQMRASLRGRVEQSSLTDADFFVRDLESVYRELWRKRCESAAR